MHCLGALAPMRSKGVESESLSNILMLKGWHKSARGGRYFGGHAELGMRVGLLIGGGSKYSVLWGT